MSYAIEVENLEYRYEDGQQALRGVTFGAEKGKVTGIVGANGAGKSTLFLNMNGVLTPSGGRVRINGEEVSYARKDLPALRRQVGVVFQDPDDQLFSADVYRDISFGAVNLGLPEEEVRARVEDAMERTGISHLRNKPTHALSYGQKKRVAIAGVLVMKPSIMVLDEPTAGLDPQGVHDIMELLGELRDHLNITIILATHDMDIIPLYCDQVYLLSEGKMVHAGTPAELFCHPEALRANHLRLPRIAHLMEILAEKDGINVDRGVSTISGARDQILKLIRGD